MPAPFDSEQTLSWPGEVLADASQLDHMERLHWRTVVRYGLGGAWIRREGSRVTVALLGQVPLLVFEREADRVEAGEIERCWRVVGGAATHGPGGTFRLGAAQSGERVRAWVRVEGMPSRLAPLPLLGRVYAAYHAMVSNGYLRALRASGSARRS